MDSVFPSATLSILVVEDDAELRAAIVRTLTQAGYEAVPASSGEDALDLIAAAEFDRLCCASELPAARAAAMFAPPSTSSGQTLRWSMPPRLPRRSRDQKI